MNVPDPELPWYQFSQRSQPLITRLGGTVTPENQVLTDGDSVRVLQGTLEIHTLERAQQTLSTYFNTNRLSEKTDAPSYFRKSQRLSGMRASFHELAPR
jgi:hypothetical protein